MNLARYILIAVTIMCCGPKQDTYERKVTFDLPRDSAEVAFEMYVRKQLKDSTVNGVRLAFEGLSRKSYDSMWRLELPATMPIEEGGGIVQLKQNCITFRYRDGRRDSLCNKTEGENEIRYSFKGVWMAKNLLLISYSDWEGGNDFFLSLSDGSLYNLASNYDSSPDERFLVTYSDPGGMTWTNEMLIANVRAGAVETILHLDFPDLTVTDAAWIADNQCLVSVAGVRDGENDHINLAFYLLTIN